MTKSIVRLILSAALLAACQPTSQAAQAGGGQTALKVIAAETFLADITQNVAGDRLQIEVLMPIGVDPHGFEPTPADVAKIADSQVVIVNGAGFEEFMAELLENAGGQKTVVEAAAGLTQREPKEGEHAEEPGDEHAHEGDPHFWLDPNKVIKYVENIRDGLSQADPEGAATYQVNAETYIVKLKELDRWIADRVKEIPEADRKLVTNHESFGYFADRYGFQIIGTVMPGVSTGSAPSAQQLAQLIDHIKQIGARAIFIETGANPQLAQQVAREAGIKAVTELYSHSITAASGVAPTYLDMLKFNTETIVTALK
ncbi:Manganese-binding lipoprotein MntA [Thermoflexales bacterium]|nr:Manganese-binding lipoprotein MntA [Thermoflexales bacterium]